MIFRTILIPSIFIFQAVRAADVHLTLEGAAAYAVAHNPSLAAARYRIEEARGRLDNAGRLTNPEAEFEFAQNPRAPERSFGVAWVQKFPVTNRLRLEKAVSRAELVAAEAEVREAERKIAGQARTVAVKLLALKKQRGLRDQQITNSKELSDFMTRRVQAGEAGVVDAAQVDLEAKQLSTQLLQLEVEQTTLLGELRPLLGLRASDQIHLTGELPDVGQLPSQSAALNARGDYLAAQANAEAARRGLDLARANKWEDIGVGLTAEHAREEDAPEGFERDTMLGFKVSLPLPIWNKNEGKIREAAAAAQRTEKEVEAIALQISAETGTARSEMAAWARIVAEIDEKLIPQAKQIEEQLRSNYTTGQAPLPEVIRARGRRFELEAQRLDALRDYHLARAKHATALGAPKSAIRVQKSKGSSK
jgi:outer membrane protein, heavy metal efflux system